MKERVPGIPRGVWRGLVMAGALALVGAPAHSAEDSVMSATPVPVSVIYDTDMHTDCDDIGTLALLHALADLGEARILAVVHSVPAPWGPRCIEAVNRYYGRAGIPVGSIAWPDYESSPVYAHYRASHRHLELEGRDYLERIGRTVGDTPGTPTDAVTLYRRVLADEPEGAVVICATGMLYALARLLDSPADGISPLSGRELVARKVRLLVTMAGGRFPDGVDQFNWECDRPSAARVINNWPTALAVSPCGTDVLTGARLASETPERNPVRVAYAIYLGGPARSRSSWDQIAMLYAVRGATDLFGERTGHRVTYDAATGRSHWSPDSDTRQVYVDLAADTEAVSATIEDLMARQPAAAATPAAASP